MPELHLDLHRLDLLRLLKIMAMPVVVFRLHHDLAMLVLGSRPICVRCPPVLCYEDMVCTDMSMTEAPAMEMLQLCEELVGKQGKACTVSHFIWAELQNICESHLWDRMQGVAAHSILAA